MKIRNLLCIMALLFKYAITAQAADVTLVNFESSPDGSLTGGSTWIGSAAGLYVGANPLKSGINTTDKAAYATRTATQGTTFQAEFNVASVTYSGTKYIHAMVLKPKHSLMKLNGRQQVPDAGYQTWNDRFSVYSFYTDVENQWVDVVFKIDFGTNLRIDRLVFSLDIVKPTTSRYPANTNIYFDEIIINDDPQPRGDATVYPEFKTTSFPENFEGNSTIADRRYFGIYSNWNNTQDADINKWMCMHQVTANPDQSGINNSSKALKLLHANGATWWSRISFSVNKGSGMAITSANNYLHIMVKKNQNAQFAVRFNYTDNTNDDWKRSTPDYTSSAWQDLVIAVPGVGKTLKELQIYPESAGLTYDLDVYIDEIIFDNNSSPRTAVQFSGNTGASWGDASNWSYGSVPTSTTPVVIPTGKSITIPAAGATCSSLNVQGTGSLTIQAGGTLTVNGAFANNTGSAAGLVIESNATQTGSLRLNGTISGNVTLKRYMTGKKWHMTGSPLSGQTIQDFIANNINLSKSGNIRAMSDFDPVANSWNSFFTTSTTGELSTGKGYQMRLSGDGTVSFTGTPTGSDVAVSVGKDWNCLTNPYTSAINLNTTAGSSSLLNETNISLLAPGFENVYVWDEAYSTTSYRPIGNLTAEYIQSGQAFFLRFKEAGTFNFLSSMQNIQPNATFRSADANEWPFIQLKAQSGSETGSTEVRFNDAMSTGFDRTYDAGLFRSAKNFALYTRMPEGETRDLSLQCLPFSETVIPVGLDCPAGSEVTFTTSALNIEPGTELILEDRLSGKLINSPDGQNSYQVSIPEGNQGTGRFFLHVIPQRITTNIEKQSATSFRATYQNGILRITGKNIAQKRLSIFDSRGEILFEERLKENDIHTPVIKLGKGVYMIKAGNSVQKIIVM